MKKNLVIILISGVTVFFSLFSNREPVLKIGDKAPLFTLQDESGAIVSLQQIKGKVALVFFPKAHTLSFGCKKEVCTLRDSFADLKEHGITVLGICDSSKANREKFVKNNRLPFHILFAPKEVMKAYGVAGGWFGAKRHTILIKDGIVVGIITDVDIERHPEQIIAGFERIQSR